MVLTISYSMLKLSAPFRQALNSYNDFLCSKYPKVYALQNAVIFGTKTTFIEGKDYAVATTRFLQHKPLSYKEVFIRWQYPRDLLKLSPVLVVMLLPFSTVALLPLVYYFPGIFTRHFWTDVEHKENATKQIRGRLAAVPDIVKHVERNIQRLHSEHERDILKYVVNQVKTDRILAMEDVKALVPIFSRSPFALDYLPRDYLWDLAWLNRIFPWRAERYAAQLASMDSLLTREFVSGLKGADIQQAVLIRCCKPYADRKELEDFLRIWTTASSIVSEPASSLRLHFPLFFSYPHHINNDCRPKS